MNLQIHLAPTSCRNKGGVALGNRSDGCGQRSLGFSRRNWDGVEPGERSDLQASQKVGAEPAHSQVGL